ncbi:hypothetical protein FQA47_007080 [Oryzias melastigma]|uniref:Uncharacterized protein n=1 Tax=Oryzias melastigma TaxID=30732 RepID=A0A834BUP8_ORYME|nr:hypothetical protein FQA47_007080 [Oryzias melastigma]
MHVQEGDLGGEGERSSREGTRESGSCRRREKETREGESGREQRPATARLPLSAASRMSLSTAVGLLQNCERASWFVDCKTERLSS